MRLSIVGILYDIIVWQAACSVLIASVFVVGSIHESYEQSSILSVINMSIFVMIQWMIVSMLLLTMDIMILPPIFLVLHVTCGLPYACHRHHKS